MAQAKKKATKKNEAPVVEEAPTETAAPEAAAAELSINDLVAVRNIIDIASQRGAFKAGEMEAVGKAFNKLNLFLDSVIPKDGAKEEEAA